VKLSFVEDAEKNLFLQRGACLNFFPNCVALDQIAPTGVVCSKVSTVVPESSLSVIEKKALYLPVNLNVRKLVEMESLKYSEVRGL